MTPDAVVSGVAKGDRTRALILDTALRQFREQSFEATTMRGIARAAGVSVGNAYHYFSGKEELVQAFYAEIQDEHRRRATPALAAAGTDLAERMRVVLHAGIDVMSPHHAFAGSFIKVAIDPASASSPFSSRSAPSRAAAVDLFADVVHGSRTALGPKLRAELPHLLWLAYLGVTVFWVHDDSPQQARTRTLINRVCPMLGRLLRLARLPVLRSTVDDVLELARSLRS